MFSMTWDPRVETLADYPTDRLVGLMREASGVPDLMPTILRVDDFTFTAQVAERYREGRAFLIGDAAHRMTPRGGAGMNTAIHDGFDLGWRLGWVLRGWAEPSLLHSYERERRPIGVRNTERSASPQAERDVSGDYLDDLNGRLPHAWLTDGRSTLDLIGAGLTLITGPQGRVWNQAATCPTGAAEIQVRPVDAEVARILGVGADGAMLVRPDGRPVSVWPNAAGHVDLPAAIAGMSVAPEPVQA